MPKVMKIANMKETFVDEWVAAEVTKMNKANVPVAGEVVTHSPDKREVYRTVKAYLAQHPAARMFVFFTGDPIPESVEVMLALR
jgi:monomeric isocitrate dehydrogenase